MIRTSYTIRPAKHLAVLLLAVIAAAATFSLLPQAGEAAEDVKVSQSEIGSEIVVVMEQDPEGVSSRSAPSTSEGITSAVEEAGGRLEDDDTADDIKTARFEELTGDKEAIAEKAEEISRLPGVRFAEPNQFVRMHYAPNDTFFSRPRGTANQGNFSMVGMPKAWNYSKGAGVSVGIADSGLIQGYGELPPAKISAQTDKLNGDAIADDTVGHGTSMASLAAARTDNKFGMAGAGFNAKVAMCKFSAKDPKTGLVGGSTKGLLRCMNWLQTRPEVKVINLSIGTLPGNESDAIAFEVKESQERYKKLVVASAGNGGRYLSRQIPASLPGVVGVGSNDSRTKRSSFSNRGPFVDLMAPGNNVVSLVGNGEKPILGSGTSYSAPTVSGCAALLFAKGYNVDQVRSRLLRTATNMGVAGRDDSTGYGILNCGKAISD